MKVFVTSICALLALSSTAVAQNISAEDFDLYGHRIRTR
jgi:hypothetical protein